MLCDYIRESRDVLEKMLHDSELNVAMEKTIEAILSHIKASKPLMVCGNGGSAADAQHIVTELVGRYLKERPAFQAICLSDNSTLLTALGNDYGYEDVFARQVEAYGRSGGILLAISTSGNSPNIIKALKVAKQYGLTRIGLTGANGGAMVAFCDIIMRVPSQHTPLIQQAHQCLYHYLCGRIESDYLPHQ